MAAGSTWCRSWGIVLLAALFGALLRKPANTCIRDYPVHPIPVSDSEHHPRKEMVAIVTGSTGGLGLATAERLLKLGVGSVYITGRTLEAAKQAADGLKSDGAIPAELDLASFASVVKFATMFSLSHSRLDILINNAAVVRAPYAETQNGFESQIGVNHLGHYLLTRLLFPKLRNATFLSGGETARIIHVTSRAADTGQVAPELWKFSLFGSPGGSPGQFYGSSKLAQVLFANELANRLKEAGASITSNSVHPGVVITGAGRHIVPEPFQFLVPWAASLLSGNLLHTVDEGIGTQIRLALSPNMSSVSGAFLETCKPRYLASKEYFDRNSLELIWEASRFYVDPQGHLMGSDVNDVKPVENWWRYIPPGPVESLEEFDFFAKFDIWKQDQYRAGTEALGVTAQAHVQQERQPEVKSCTATDCVQFISEASPSSSCTEQDCESLIESKTIKLLEDVSNAEALLVKQQKQCELEKQTMKVTATSDCDDKIAAAIQTCSAQVAAATHAKSTNNDEQCKQEKDDIERDFIERLALSKMECEKTLKALRDEFDQRIDAVHKTARDHHWRDLRQINLCGAGFAREQARSEALLKVVEEKHNELREVKRSQDRKLQQARESKSEELKKVMGEMRNAKDALAKCKDDAAALSKRHAKEVQKAQEEAAQLAKTQCNVGETIPDEPIGNANKSKWGVEPLQADEAPSPQADEASPAEKQERINDTESSSRVESSNGGDKVESISSDKNVIGSSTSGDGSAEATKSDSGSSINEEHGEGSQKISDKPSDTSDEDVKESVTSREASSSSAADQATTEEIGDDDSIDDGNDADGFDEEDEEDPYDGEYEQDDGVDFFGMMGEVDAPTTTVTQGKKTTTYIGEPVDEDDDQDEGDQADNGDL